MGESSDRSIEPDALLAEVVVADDLLVLDVNGDDGTIGRDGKSYSGRQASTGQRGRQGEDARSAQAGENAGDMEVSLRPAGNDESRLELVGVRAVAHGAERAVRETVKIGNMGVVRLFACGGRGGDGGRGGAGQAGGKGHDGADATRWSSGDDGGRGGDGGDGGDGTSGADGGNGGRIVVKVDDADTHLLMLAKYVVRGGEGGKPGVNGRGGEGGDGGDGGRSHSWTTTSTEHYTDAQGQTQSRTRTHHHRNRGGSDGQSGQRGRDGRARLQVGDQGRAGDVRIVVRHGHGSVQYLQRFEVELTHYDVELTDRFAEPTSEVRLLNFSVRNSGGMPTPTRCPVEVYLASSRWLEPQRHVLVLPRSLEPGESYTFADALLLGKVPDIAAPPQDDPLCQSDRVSPLVRQSGANRLFDNLHPRRSFDVAFPSDLQPVQSLESQTTGRAARFVIGLTNRSQFDLGRASASQRVLGVHVELENMELAEHVMLIDPNGHCVDWSAGYEQEIDCLTAGDAWSSELIFGILPGAPGYLQARVRVELRLGQIDQPLESKVRHCRVYPVRIAQAYDYDPSADILLIVNHGTTMEELAAWHAAAERLEQTIAVWDISLNDSLSLSEKLAHGQSLLRDFHGRTIVLGNAPFHTALGTRYGDQFLSQMDLIKAAESHGIRVLVVNDQQHDVTHLFKERLVPTDGQPEYRYDSLDALERAEPLDDVDVLLDQVDELIEHGAQAARPNPISQTSEVDLYGIRSPNAARLRKQAIKLQRKLQHASPGRRVVVMYKMPSELSDEQREERAAQPPRGGWFFTHDYQGTLTVMPTLGDDHPNLVVLNAAPTQMREPGFVENAAVSAGLAQSLGFEEKVYLLDAKMKELGEQWRIDPESVKPSEVAGAQFLVDAILVDLATEQATILKTSWKGPFSNALIRNALRQLKLLTEHPFALLTGGADQPDVQLAARLVAGIEFLGRNSSRWYESRLFPWGIFRRGPVLRKEILKHGEALTKNLFHQQNDAQTELIEQCVDQYYLQLKETKRQLRIDKKKAAREVLYAPLLEHGIITDAGRTFPSVLSFEQWQAIRQAELERENARVQLREQKTDDRTSYAVARNGRPLPDSSPELQAALQPFVDACAAARTALQQHRPRRNRHPLQPLPALQNAQETPDQSVRRAKEEA